MYIWYQANNFFFSFTYFSFFFQYFQYHGLIIVRWGLMFPNNVGYIYSHIYVITNVLKTNELTGTVTQRNSYPRNHIQPNQHFLFIHEHWPLRDTVIPHHINIKIQNDLILYQCWELHRVMNIIKKYFKINTNFNHFFYDSFPIFEIFFISNL